MRKTFGHTRPKPKEHVRTVQPPAELLRAIRERRVVTFHYDGLYREVEPHACGVFENGRTVLIAYQIGGQSKSDSEPPWRTFSVEKISGLTLTDRIFSHNRPDYNPYDNRFNPVFAKVQ